MMFALGNVISPETTSTLEHVDVAHNGVPQWPVRQQLAQTARKRQPSIEIVT